MSALNGDKARFNRVRRQKIARRIRNRELQKIAATQLKSADTPTRVKPSSVPA